MSGQVLHLAEARTGGPSGPRNAIEVEGRVVGALMELGDTQALLDAMGLTQADFSDSRCAVVFRLIQLMARKRDTSVVAEAVHSYGERTRLLEGSLDWLLGMQATAPTDRKLALQLAADVRIMAAGRRHEAQLRGMLEDHQRRGFNPGRAAEQLTSMAEGLSVNFRADDTADVGLMQMLENWQEHEEKGSSILVPTGLQVLDQQIVGLPPKLTLLVAGEGVGKTSVITSMIRAQLEHVLKPDECVGVVGLEDGTEWIHERWVAAETGIELAQVGWAKRTPEQAEAVHAAGERLFPLMKRIIRYDQSTITVQGILSRATSWKLEHNVRCIFIDNLQKIPFRSWEDTAAGVRALTEWAHRHKTPVLMVAHTTHDKERQREENGPPRVEFIAGGRALGREARLIIALWESQHSKAWRLTVIKGNKVAAKGTTVELERIPHAGMVTSTGGRVVDLDREDREARAAKREQSLEARVEDGMKLKTMRERLAAKKPSTPDPEPAPPVAQRDIFGGDK